MTKKHELIGKEFDVLSHGSIMLVDYMGSDEDIESAARISYGEGTRPVSDTIKLLRYLKRHRHTTPFEMAELKFKIKMPMDVNRQWIRHRTANVNEYSTRYSEPISDTDTTPVWRKQSTNNKQGSSGTVEEWPSDDKIEHAFSGEIEGGMTAPQFLTMLEQEAINSSKNFYDIAQRFDVAKEVCRKHLPLSTYTEIFWKCDLHNIMHFLSLRCDSHAQQEIRNYADIMAGIIKEIFPISMKAWYDYEFKSPKMSREEMLLLSSILNRYDVDLEDVVDENNEDGVTDLKGREKQEFISKFSSDYSDSFHTDFGLPSTTKTE